MQVVEPEDRDRAGGSDEQSGAGGIEDGGTQWWKAMVQLKILKPGG